MSFLPLDAHADGKPAGLSSACADSPAASPLLRAAHASASPDHTTNLREHITLNRTVRHVRKSLDTRTRGGAIYLTGTAPRRCTRHVFAYHQYFCQISPRLPAILLAPPHLSCLNAPRPSFRPHPPVTPVPEKPLAKTHAARAHRSTTSGSLRTAGRTSLTATKRSATAPTTTETTRKMVRVTPYRGACITNLASRHASRPSPACY